MTLNSCLIIVAKVKLFLYVSFLATISFVSQSFLHQKITNEYFTYMTSPLCGCKVEITMNPFHSSILRLMQN